MMLFASLFLLIAARAAEDCACTGDNSLIPESNPTFSGTGYGRYCEAWDISRDYCQVGDITYSGGDGKNENPSDDSAENNWCSQPWCYVQKGCIVGERDWHSEDQMSKETDAKQTVVFKDDEGKAVELYYSYLHCGPFRPNGIEWPDFEPCQPRENPIDVYFLVDGSSSINAESWENQGFFLSQLIKTIDQEGDRIGMVQFSGKLKLEYTFADKKEDIVEGVLTMPQLKGGTKTDTAYDMMLKQWAKEDYSAPWDGENRKKVVVLVTDGIPNPASFNPCMASNEKTNKIQQRLKNLGSTNVIIAVDMAVEDRALLSCLVEKPLLNIVQLDDFKSFDQYRDPTGSANLLCADPSTLTRMTKDMCEIKEGPRRENRCIKRVKCVWRDGDCHERGPKKIGCHKMTEEECKTVPERCVVKYLNKKRNRAFKRCKVKKD